MQAFTPWWIERRRTSCFALSFLVADKATFTTRRNPPNRPFHVCTAMELNLDCFVSPWLSYGKRDDSHWPSKASSSAREEQFHG